MADKVVIVDYGTGNLLSVQRGFARIGAETVVSDKRSEIADCDKLVLSGVGHFGTTMDRLRRSGLVDELQKAVIFDKKPVLGICLGMELMAKTSEEGKAIGLGWLDADVVRFNVKEKLKYKVPHIGWNKIVKRRESSSLMKDIPDSSEFYFLHSYYAIVADQSDVLTETTYESAFASSVERGNIYGVQFHPEKSHKVGLQLLKNFFEL